MSEVGKKKKSSSSKAKSFSLPSGESVPQVLPVLATSEITPFPSVVMSLFVSNSVGIHAVEEAVAQEDYLVLATHAGISDDSPKFEALSEIGVLGRVLRTMGLPDGGIKVLVQGVLRVKIQEPQTPSSARALHAFVEPIHAPKSITLSAEDESLVNRIHENLRILVDNDYFPEEILVVTDAIDGPGELADVVAAHHQLDVERGNVFLQETNPLQSLRLVDELLTQTLNQYFVNERIRTQAQERMSEEQREYLLRSQLKVIQRELGDEMDEAESLEDLRSNLAAAKLPALVQKEADRQLSRLDRMPPESSEYSLLRTYLEW
ncbi:MAG: LON peptidase substrate-binding domain-containing protein, partial [Bdellovibrionales bacterium]|nr:LON peptidase substrate-binding domain-containing protein [Bdellovibrionales bacterium]